MTVSLALLLYFAPPGSGWGKTFRDLFKNDNPPKPHKPKPEEAKPVQVEVTTIERRVEAINERQKENQTSVRTLSVGAGFRFGFGFAAGFFVFNLLLAIVAWMLVGAAVNATINSIQHSLLMPTFPRGF